MTQNCRDILAGPGSGMITFQQWDMARLNVNKGVSVFSAAARMLQ